MQDLQFSRFSRFQNSQGILSLLGKQMACKRTCEDKGTGAVAIWFEDSNYLFKGREQRMPVQDNRGCLFRIRAVALI